MKSRMPNCEHGDVKSRGENEGMAKAKSDTAEKVEIYQFHIRLDGISPMIWRRILIRSDSTLEDLHKIIQIGMCQGL